MDDSNGLLDDEGFDVLAYEQENILHAVDVLILLSKLQYRRMQEAAMRVHNTPKADPGHKFALSVFFGDAMAFVNAVDQLRRLAPRLPYGGEFRAWKRSFAKDAAAQEEARHHLNHLDRSIRRAAEARQPAFGIPSWIVPPSSPGGEGAISWHISGTIQAHAHYPEQSFAEAVDRPVGAFKISIAGEPYDLSAAHRAVCELEQRLAEHRQVP